MNKKVQKFSDDFENCYLYFGCENGFIQVIDLTNILNVANISSVKSYEHIFPKFHPFRKENCDVS